MSTSGENLAQAAAKELPDTLIGLVVAVVATILLGLAFPGLVLWAFPLVAMFGFRIMLLGKRCNCYLSLPLGLSPFAIFVAALAIAYMLSDEMSRNCTRLLLGLYGMFFVPLSLYVSGEVRRWGGAAPPLAKWIADDTTGKMAQSSDCGAAQRTPEEPQTVVGKRQDAAAGQLRTAMTALSSQSSRAF